MKRFFLFGGETYYPGGGWWDFEGSFDTLEEATAAGLEVIPEKVYPAIESTAGSFERKGFTVKARKRFDWSHVIDTETWERTNINDFE